jgi:hypothetical protein
MQLEATLFGILVIQIKPQLEKVLNLPPNSLQKEIALTRDLMEMFIDYQIPGDLLSSSSGADDNLDHAGILKVSALDVSLAEVKSNVGAMKVFT